MSLETIITQFGYPALVVGLLLEGETVLVLGAFMAHRGYLDLPLVICIGWVVAFAADQFFFWLGRLVECDRTDRMFTAPSEKLTEDYVTGRFG